MTWRAIVLVAMLGLSGCGDDSGAAVPPAPLEPGADASGHFCGMSLLEHAGPKGQVHLRGRAEPLWFTSVRDTLAFALLPDEPWPIDAIFVNDMGRASWARPEPGTWIEARRAWYVVGSTRAGGMGAAETIPFAERDAARRFADEHGGVVLGFDDIPRDAVLGRTETSGANR